MMIYFPAQPVLRHPALVHNKGRPAPRLANGQTIKNPHRAGWMELEDSA